MSETDTRWANDDATAFRGQVRDYLRDRRDRGQAYVKAKHVARAFDVMPQKAGAALDRLADEGAVTTWGSSPRTYRIDVDDGGDA